jgi:hypothetical protein
MAAQWFRCTDKQCGWYARVAVENALGERVRACARYAVAVLEHLARAQVIWDNTRGINDYETTALLQAEERSQLSREDATARPTPLVRRQPTARAMSTNP